MALGFKGEGQSVPQRRGSGHQDWVQVQATVQVPGYFSSPSPSTVILHVLRSKYMSLYLDTLCDKKNPFADSKTRKLDTLMSTQ